MMGYRSMPLGRGMVPTLLFAIGVAAAVMENGSEMVSGEATTGAGIMTAAAVGDKVRVLAKAEAGPVIFSLLIFHLCTSEKIKLNFIFLSMGIIRSLVSL
jgi:hypothetical protein